MLAQFQVRYPTGSLISELLTIYEGKFVVRVSAQVEGVTRATGMAAAETLELAEDRARSRALEVMAVDQATPTLPEKSTQPFSDSVPEFSLPTKAVFSPEPIGQTNPSRFFETTKELNDPAYSSFSPASPVEESTTETAVSPRVKENARFAFTPTPSAQEPDATAENFRLMSDTENSSTDNPPIPFGNVTPLVPRSYSPQKSSGTPSQTGVETEMVASEPIDLSDVIALTTVEVKRLGWSKKEGSEYLKRTYGKPTRQDLTDEEMLEFLHYLKSQPSPN